MRKLFSLLALVIGLAPVAAFANHPTDVWTDAQCKQRQNAVYAESGGIGDPAAGTTNPDNLDRGAICVRAVWITVLYVGGEVSRENGFGPCGAIIVANAQPQVPNGFDGPLGGNPDWGGDDCQ